MHLKMYIYLFFYICIYMYIYTYVYICLHLYLHMYVYIYEGWGGYALLPHENRAPCVVMPNDECAPHAIRTMALSTRVVMSVGVVMCRHRRSSPISPFPAPSPLDIHSTVRNPS